MKKEELVEFGKLVLDTFHSEGKTKSGKPRLTRIKYDEWVNEKLTNEPNKWTDEEVEKLILKYVEDKFQCQLKGEFFSHTDWIKSNLK